MKDQYLLEDLGKLTNKKRIKAIAKNPDYVLGEEFISFMKGQLEFTKEIEKNSMYFERIYVGEDSTFLDFMKSEMRQHSKMVREVWRSMEKYVEQHDMEVLLKTGLATAFGRDVDDMGTENLPCGKCDELIQSHGLCTGCLSGNLPNQVKETLLNKSENLRNSEFVSNKEILSNNSNKHLD